MTLPNFLIIGAAKSGTTSLYHYLKQHPQIYMSPHKEPGYFSYAGDRQPYLTPWGESQINRLPYQDPKAYRRLFEQVRDERCIGEASVTYLSHPDAPVRIAQEVPHAKLIAILRHPADRAYSAYTYLRRGDREPIESFAEALQAEEQRITENWDPAWRYRQQGDYGRFFQRYLTRFDRSQIRVFLYEDLQNDPLKVCQDAFRFLDVDPDFEPNVSQRFNRSGLASSWWTRRLQLMVEHRNTTVKRLLRPFIPMPVRQKLVTFMLNSVLGRQMTRPAPLDPAIRAALVTDYREDIEQLQTLIQRDLSHWLN